MNKVRFFILAAFLSCSLAIVFANNGDSRDEILLNIGDLIKDEYFDKAKEEYLQNITILKDNGVYEAWGLSLYGIILEKEGSFEEALNTLKHCTSILDANYKEIISLKDFNLIRPYYLHAYLAQYANSLNTKELYYKAKKAFEDSGFQKKELYLYWQICEELKKLESSNDVDYLNKIIQSINMDIQNQNFDSAMNKIEQCFTILDKIKAPPHKIYAALYQLKGRIAWGLGNTNMAESSYLEALKQIEDLTPSSPEMQDLALKIYIDLGTIYGAVKDYDNCASILWLVKNRLEQKGDLGYEYARALGNIAIAFAGKGAYLKASIYLETAIDILQELGDVNPSEIASLYSSASICYNEMSNFDEAKASALKAREYLKSGQAFPSSIAQIENNIGIISVKQKDYTNAYNSFKNAYKIAGNSSLSPLIQFNFASCLYLTGNKDLIDISIKNSELLQQEVLLTFLFLSESQRLNYWDQTGGFFNGYNRYLFGHDSPKANETIYNNALFAKGLLLRTSNWLTEELSNPSNKEDRNRIRQISEYRNIVSSGQDSLGYYQGLIIGLEKELIRSNISYATLRNNLTTDWKEVCRSLSKNEAAIEFIQLPIIKENDFTEKVEYAAIIVKHNSKSPIIIPICTEDSLSQILAIPQQLQRINDDTQRNEYYRAYLYGNGTFQYRMGINRRKIETVGENLYGMLWQAITPYLKGIRTIYYAPIGTLNTLSFGALTSNNVTLSDKYNLHLVSSTFEIPHIKDRQKSTQLSSVVYGGIKYDADPDSLIAESRGYDKTNLLASTDRGFSPDGSDRSGWAFLPGTLAESESISHRVTNEGITCRLITGVAANEESFKALSGNSPSLLHVATHGFFLSSKQEVETNDFLKTVNLHIPSSQQIMNRTGLLFAGANRAWTGKDIIDGIEDGILTANEISNLNLSSTDLVVLSACETGLGENLASEGVFGLQRAFKLAGVKTIIMSLWKVPDAETSQLMKLFYDNWLNGMEIHEAFRKAQLAIKAEKPNPYFWAGFVILD